MSGRKFYLIDECHNYIILKLIDIYEKAIYQITRKNELNELFFEEAYELKVKNKDKESSFNIIITNPMDSFFACAENENQVVETKNVDLKIKKYNSFSNAKKCNLSYDKNIFSNGSAAEKVGPFFDYIKRFITTIKSYFDCFIERKYKCRIFAT